MSKPFRLTLLTLIALSGIAFILIPRSSLPAEEISRPRLLKMLDAGHILEVRVHPKTPAGIYSIHGQYERGIGKTRTPFTITTHLNESQLDSLLALAGAEIQLPKNNTPGRALDIVCTLLVAGLVIGIVAYQVNIGKSRQTHRIRARPAVRFDEIAGIEEAKAEVQEIIDFLRSPEKYRRIGGTLPKGVLLIGPPGTGKTMLAKAIASEANASFFSASGSDFTEVYVGVGARRVRELFRQARKHKPSIVFIDEIDCLGKNRKHDHNGELQQTNNALLTAMDGFEASDGVIVMAATNRPEDLDEALTRPGRFDRKVFVPLPDARGRRAILASHSRKTRLAAMDRALDVLAQTTPGMSGADLANLINEAAILSVQRGKTEISMTELEEARDKVRFGKERRSMVLMPDERRVVAFHEAGHAIIYLQKTLLPPLHKVSIIPRGQSLGSTTVLPRQDQNIHSRKFLLEQLAVLMGGRAAEQVFFGDITNGANGDLDSARNIARKMVHEWGMGQRLYYEPGKPDAEIEINQLLSTAYAEALADIQANEAQTARIAEALLHSDTLSRDEVLALVHPDDAGTNPPAVLLPDPAPNRGELELSRSHNTIQAS